MWHFRLNLWDQWPDVCLFVSKTWLRATYHAALSPFTGLCPMYCIKLCPTACVSAELNICWLQTNGEIMSMLAQHCWCSELHYCEGTFGTCWNSSAVLLCMDHSYSGHSSTKVWFSKIALLCYSLCLSVSDVQLYVDTKHTVYGQKPTQETLCTGVV